VPRPILLVLIACTCLAFSCSGERQINTYSSVTEARSDNLFARGWIPDVLREDDGPIVEFHDLDTNARCSKSKLRESTAAVVSALHQAGFAASEEKLPSLPSRRCPFSMRDVTADPASFVGARRSSDGAEYAVVRDGYLFFWSR
jgi:hypothetical protein